MDANTPRDEDDLSEIEHRLTNWHPVAEGLDADAMLFAAGLAAGRRGPGRFLAPALCGLLAVLGVGLGAWGLTERAERQALASRLHEQAPTPSTSPTTDVAPRPAYDPSPEDYLTMRRRMEQDPNGLLSSPPPPGVLLPKPPPPGPEILSPRQRDDLFDQ